MSYAAIQVEFAYWVGPYHGGYIYIAWKASADKAIKSAGSCIAQYIPIVI